MKTGKSNSYVKIGLYLLGGALVGGVLGAGAYMFLDNWGQGLEGTASQLYSGLQALILPVLAVLLVLSVLAGEITCGKLKKIETQLPDAEDEESDRLEYEEEKWGALSMNLNVLSQVLCIIILAAGYSSNYLASSEAARGGFLYACIVFILCMVYDSIWQIRSVKLVQLGHPEKKADPSARNFQKKLYEKTKLYCSIGISTNKFLAKMGSDYKKPNGITILRKKDFRTIIYPLDLSSMYGIGRKTSPRLIDLGIQTIGDLANKIKNNDEDVRNILGKFYFTIEKWLNGEGDDEINFDEERNPKSIQTSTTLKYDTNEYMEIRSVIKNLSKDVAYRLKKENKLAKTITLVIKDTDFISKSKSITLDKPISDEDTIFDVCLDLLDKFYDNRLIRLIGVGVSNFVDIKDVAVQMTFYDYEEGIKQSQTKLLINELNRHLSKPMLFRAIDAIKEKDNGHKRRNR